MVYLLKMVIFHGKLLNNQMVIIIRIRSVGVSNEPPLLGSKNGRLMEKMIWDFGVAWKKLRQTQGDQILIGGLEHELCDFPFSWELSSSQLTFTPFFSRIDTGNIPWGHGILCQGMVQWTRSWLQPILDGCWDGRLKKPRNSPMICH